MIADRIIQIIAAAQNVPAGNICLDSSFLQLGIDSLDAINIVFALEEEFNLVIPDDAVRSIRTVRQVVQEVSKALAANGDIRPNAEPSHS